MSKRTHHRYLGIIGAILIGAALAVPAISNAQSANSTSLTITPPFFDLDVNPGDSWSSAIEVVNTNATDLQVHAELMGFGAGDDQGHGAFTPLSELSDDGEALANWITISSSSVDVPRGGSANIPFSISIPPNASPGGHYAAILIGTGAPAGQSGTSQVGVSSYISALIFVRVAGDIVESAQIKQFSSDKSYYQTPNVNFNLVFQNMGDVHVRPVGEIQIYNAFGKERGEIPINNNGNLGYVLPSSSREFNFQWQGQPSLLDIGPYTAVVSLAYGENGTKSVSQTIGFWVVPIDQILEILLGVIAAASIFVFILRRAVRRMLNNEITKYGGVPEHSEAAIPPKPPKPKKKWGFGSRKKSTAPPPAPGTLDLRNKKDKE